MKRAAFALVFVTLTALFGGAIWHHELQREITFVGMSEDETGVHPGRVMQIAFQDTTPSNLTVLLNSNDGHAVETVHWSPPEDPTMLFIRSEQPLNWDRGYRLCVLRHRSNIMHRLLGLRKDCIEFHSQARPLPDGEADASMLIVTGPDSVYGSFYGPILQAEGFSDFATTPVEDVSASSIVGRKVILLATTRVPSALTAELTTWVNAGGLLIAMRPDPVFLSSLGLGARTSSTIFGGLLTVDPMLPFTKGLTPVPIRLHGMIELFDMPVQPRDGSAEPWTAGTNTQDHDAAVQLLGQLRDGRGTRLPYPAGVLARQGLGMAAIFPFDLAETVVLSRQGNPRWIDQDRDGSKPRRTNDLFFPDHVDLDRMHVPQADELQRLLANIIVTAAPYPVPRFWYLPEHRRAAIIMTADDHGTTDGTRNLFTTLAEQSPPDCDLDRWDCLRATSYLTPDTVLSPEDAAAFARQGFEMGVHVDTGCQDVDDTEMEAIISDQIDAFRLRYPELPAQQTERLHCIVWNGWVDVPVFERTKGIRFDMNYYSWPPGWLQQRPGFMTGSGFPLPFVDQDGDILDIYQAATHMVNESGVPQAFGISSLLDRALNEEQYFGAFGTHVDFTDDYAAKIIESAKARGIALITAEQMLRWLDAKNGSDIRLDAWDGTTLNFDVDVQSGAEWASVMLPEVSEERALINVSCNGQQRDITREEMKGVRYVFFAASEGLCAAHYARLPRESQTPVGQTLQ